VSCRCEKLITKADDSSGTQRRRNVLRWKLLPSSGSEEVPVDTSVCVCVCVCETVYCKVVAKSPINSIIIPKTVYSHTPIT
jgi:hypothetical protein